MKDWVKKLDTFLRFNEREILEDNGKISHEIAVALTENEFEIFQKTQDKNYISDFDQEVKKILEIKKKNKKETGRVKK